MTVTYYIEEFYKLDVRFGHADDEVDKVSKCLNGLTITIQDEINFINMETLEEAYLYALRDEEILEKKQHHRQRTRGGRFQ